MTAATAFKRLGIRHRGRPVRQARGDRRHRRRHSRAERVRDAVRAGNRQRHRPRSRPARHGFSFAVSDRLRQLQPCQPGRRRRQTSSPPSGSTRGCGFCRCCPASSRSATSASSGPHITVAIRPRRPLELVGPGGPAGAGSRPEGQARRRGGAFSEIRIADGTVVVREGRTHGLSETLTDVELALAWPSISRSFAATGRMSWNGQTIDTALQPERLRLRSRRRALRHQAAA